MLFRNIYAAIAGGKMERFFAGPEDDHPKIAFCEAIVKSNRASDG